MMKIASVLPLILLSACTGAHRPACVTNAVETLGEGSYRVQVTAQHDGDTFTIAFPGLPPELPLRVRLRGADTPEIDDKAKCDSEQAAGQAAKRFTAEKLALTHGSVVISKLRWDKYGGRVDADVYVGQNRDSLSSLLIENHQAREYLGGKRQGWC